MQLVLGHTELLHNEEAGRNRFAEIYWYIDDIADLSIQAACFARLVSVLTEVGRRLSTSFEGEEVYRLALEKLAGGVERLIVETAEHYSALRNTLRSLARSKPTFVLEVASKLNTEDRRDRAHLEIVRSAASLPADDLDLRFLYQVMDQIANPESRDAALLFVLHRLAIAPNDAVLDLAHMTDALKRIAEISDSSARCNACCLAYSLLFRWDDDQTEELKRNLLQKLGETWEGIDVGWVKIDVGFKIAKSLASVSLEEGRRYSKLAENLRDGVMLDSQAAASAYLSTLRLAIRAHAGLLQRRLDSAEDLSTLTDLIRNIPSRGEKATAVGGVGTPILLQGEVFRGQSNHTRAN